jgi:putative transposase
MPRRLRGVLPEGVYHVVSRGNRRERLFHTRDAFEEYLKLLRGMCERHDVDVLAYVLMPNHVHLLVKAPENVLSAFMRDLHGRFAQWHNRRYHLTGHVFEGRYRCWPCSVDRYLWALVRYLHDNPVRAGLVEHADEYRWSSFGAYAGQPDGVTAVARLRELMDFRRSDDLTWVPRTAGALSPVYATSHAESHQAPLQAPT